MVVFQAVPSYYDLKCFASIEIWKEHAETKIIAKLQQQFSDLKQWRMEEDARAVECDASEEDDTESEDEIHIHNAFSLLQQDD
jgi:hypothetical protein